MQYSAESLSSVIQSKRRGRHLPQPGGIEVKKNGQWTDGGVTGRNYLRPVGLSCKYLNAILPESIRGENPKMGAHAKEERVRQRRTEG